MNNMFKGDSYSKKLAKGIKKMKLVSTLPMQLIPKLNQEVEQVMASHVRWPLACNAGEWKLTIVDLHNKEDQLDGSLIDDSCPEFRQFPI